MNFNFNLKDLGMAGAGVILIIVGIALISTHFPCWGVFCIILGIAALAYAGTTAGSDTDQSDTRRTAQNITGIIAIIFFITSIIVLFVCFLHL
jgi:hypothetical protein